MVVFSEPFEARFLSLAMASIDSWGVAAPGSRVLALRGRRVFLAKSPAKLMLLYIAFKFHVHACNGEIRDGGCNPA
jgi:hypothetical protein